MKKLTEKQRIDLALIYKDIEIHLQQSLKLPADIVKSMDKIQRQILKHLL